MQVSIVRRLIRETLGDAQNKLVLDLNDDYAIVKRDGGLGSENFFVYSKKEGKVVSSFHHTLDDAKEDALTRDAKKYNLSMLGGFEDYIMKDVPDFLIQEAGIDMVLHFLAQEDGMNFQLQHMGHGAADFSKQQEPTSDDEIERILQANKIPYSLSEVRQRLVKYFIRRLSYNTPKDRTFSSTDEALQFLKTYEQQFLYEYLLPMATINKRS